MYRETIRRYIASRSMGWAMSCKSGGVPVRMPNKVLAGEQGQTQGSHTQCKGMNQTWDASPACLRMSRPWMRVWVAAAKSPWAACSLYKIPPPKKTKTKPK